MTDPEWDTRPVGFSVKPQVSVFGQMCDCGYLPTGTAETARRARLTATARSWLHRLRHPFRERRDPMAELDNRLGDAFEELAEKPSLLHGEFEPRFSIQLDREDD